MLQPTTSQSSLSSLTANNAQSRTNNLTNSGHTIYNNNNNYNNNLMNNDNSLHLSESDCIMEENNEIIDIHHGANEKPKNNYRGDINNDLFAINNKWNDFIQISNEDNINYDDDSIPLPSPLPPIGRSRLYFSRLSSKPPRPKILPKNMILTDNTTNTNTMKGNSSSLLGGDLTPIIPNSDKITTTTSSATTTATSTKIVNNNQQQTIVHPKTTTTTTTNTATTTIAHNNNTTNAVVESSTKLKLTKTSLLKMQESTTRAHLSFSKQGGKTINLKVDIFSTPTGLEIMKKETICGRAQVYGQLIYVTFDAVQLSRNETVKTEYKKMSARVVEPGSLCFWMDGSSIIFGYGQTPKSRKQECRLTENCIVFGKLNDPNYNFEVSDTNSSLYLPSVLYEIEKDIGNASDEWSVKLSTRAPISEEPIPLKKRTRVFTATNTTTTSESPSTRKKTESSDSSSVVSVEPKKTSDANTNNNNGQQPILLIDLTSSKDDTTNDTTTVITTTNTTTNSTNSCSGSSSGGTITTTVSTISTMVDDDSIIDSRKHLTLRYRYQGEDESDCKIATTQFVARQFIDYSTIISLLRRDNVNIPSLLEIRYYNESTRVWQIVPDSFKLGLVSTQTIIQILLKRK